MMAASCMKRCRWFLRHAAGTRFRSPTVPHRCAIRKGHVPGVVLIFRDESERRRTELALRNADRRKDEFLATLAHELRNPLAPISMGLELLKMSADDPQAAEEVRTMMQRQTQHMVRLIDDLLDVSRITRGKLELRKSQVELAEIVRNCARRDAAFDRRGGAPAHGPLAGKAAAAVCRRQSPDSSSHQLVKQRGQVYTA